MRNHKPVTSPPRRVSPRAGRGNQRQREEKILVAGFAQAAVLENKNVTYIRSYGAEMRGGTANCLVRVSNNEIASPVFEKASIAIIMSQPSLDKFKDKVDKYGLLVMNESTIERKPKRKGLNLKGLKLNELALKLGSIKVANVIGLGLLIKQKPFIKISTIEKIIKEIFKDRADLLNINLKALKLGYRNG
jgi:2-oxoglutarate ferredoxin oxidoreductase subunit gamma